MNGGVFLLELYSWLLLGEEVDHALKLGKMMDFTPECYSGY
jgi:hypothetical protein